MTTPQTKSPAFELPDRYLRALEIKGGERSIKMPVIDGWNPEHPLRPFQERGVAWLYTARKGLLADPVGFGKTAQALGLIALLKSQGKPFRTIVLAPNYSSQMQWFGEVRKFTDLLAVAVQGEKPVRVSQYATWWEVLITRYSLLLRDLDYMRNLEYDVVVLDEASMFRHHDIKTARFVKTLTKGIPRVVELDATPIQTSLLDMHSLLEALRMNIFGAVPAFEQRYIRREPIKIRRGNTFINATKIVGYRNMTEFKERIRPFILRRKLSEIEAEMPEVSVQDVWLTLPTVQRRYYDQARKGIIQVWETPEGDEEGQIQGGERSRRIRAGFHHLQYACDTSLAFSPDNLTSVKIDWLMNEMQNDLKGEKVVIFSKYKVGIDHVMRRLQEAGIGARRFTGDEDNDQRDEALDSFWNDDRMQALVGTAALERSLNLQKSAYMIALNQMWNPTRMIQLFGRVNRMGSEHARAILINLLTEDTFEESMQRVVRERAALPDFVFDESSELFDSLSDAQLMALIQA